MFHHAKEAFGLFLYYDMDMNTHLSCIETAHRISRLKPWLHFHDLDFFELKAYGQESIYVSILGHAKNTYGICFYFGNKAFNELLYLVENPELPNLQKARYQDALVVYYDKKEELTSEDLKLIETVDIKLSRTQRFPVLRAVHKNYPRSLTEDEVAQLDAVLILFEKALLRYNEKKPFVDFEFDEFLSFRENKNGVWSLRVREVDFDAFDYPEPKFDFFEVRNINPRRFGQQIEIDALLLDALIDQDVQTPYLVRALLIMGVEDAHVFKYQILDPNADITQTYVEAFIDFVEEYGRPEAIIVRDYEAANALDQMAAMIQTPLAVFSELVNIDDFNENIEAFNQVNTRFN